MKWLNLIFVSLIVSSLLACENKANESAVSNKENGKTPVVSTTTATTEPTIADTTTTTVAVGTTNVTTESSLDAIFTTDNTSWWSPQEKNQIVLSKKDANGKKAEDVSSVEVKSVVFNAEDPDTRPQKLTYDQWNAIVYLYDEIEMWSKNIADSKKLNKIKEQAEKIKKTDSALLGN